ncbi:hypothetical protein [Streptomyces sp. AMCC400023]|uniref:hypothetical protein n=1 Tax=Streptomyces sp. AMCC400023 TaxID=2056258 RepID=UPI001F2CD6AB|nr:hypothetical protein [Streptomyces sp. AMCC400023]UJV42985.1 hypothetical protein CVT30_26875 [Streptomyces sp. AMCC400023]
MALRSTDALVVETDGSDLTPSLPDPTTAAGRTHDLTNTATSNAVWSSTGATPFLVDGVPAANLTVLAGRARRVQSDGTRWVVAPTAARRVFSGSGVTNAGGNVTFTFTPPFPVAPNAVAQVGPSADTALFEARLTALSASAATFNVRRAPGVTLLGIQILEVPQNAPGVTVHCHAIEPGQGA